MNRILYLISLIFITVSCSKSDDNTNNQYLPNITLDNGNMVNTYLRQYRHLKYANNQVALNKKYGINGVVIYLAEGTNYSAVVVSVANNPLSKCSTLSVEDVIATCNCDDGNSYDILSGNIQPGTTGHYALKRYYVEVFGDIIRVYNN